MVEALYPENQPLILARHALSPEGFNCLVLEYRKILKYGMDLRKDRKKSFGHFLHHEKEAVLTKLCNVRQNVNILDKNICHLYEEAEKIKSCKKVVEYQLESIQQDISNIMLSEMAESTKKQKQQLWRPQL